MTKCVICGLDYSGYGNNAEPVKSGRCCNSCNDMTVIPMRMASTKPLIEDDIKITEEHRQGEQLDGFGECELCEDLGVRRYWDSEEQMALCVECYEKKTGREVED